MPGEPTTKGSNGYLLDPKLRRNKHQAMEMNHLIAAAQAGSEEALLELLECCRPQLRRYANRECASDDVEEAVQDALWLLYRRVGALRMIRAFSAWLFQIIRRE